MVFNHFQLILLTLVTTLTIGTASFHDNCSHIFQFDYDQEGKRNIGLIDVIVPKKLVDTGFEIEVLFELESFPLEVGSFYSDQNLHVHPNQCLSENGSTQTWNHR